MPDFLTAGQLRGLEPVSPGKYELLGVRELSDRINGRGRAAVTEDSHSNRAPMPMRESAGDIAPEHPDASGVIPEDDYFESLPEIKEAKAGLKAYADGLAASRAE